MKRNKRICFFIIYCYILIVINLYCYHKEQLTENIRLRFAVCYMIVLLILDIEYRLVVIQNPSVNDRTYQNIYFFVIFVLYLFVWENTIYRSEFYLAFFSSFFLFVRKRLGFSHRALTVLLCYLASDFGTYFWIFINPQSRTRGKLEVKLIFTFLSDASKRFYEGLSRFYKELWKQNFTLVFISITFLRDLGRRRLT